MDVKNMRENIAKLESARKDGNGSTRIFSKTMKAASFLLFLSLSLSLCACAHKVKLSSGEVTDDAQSITAVVTEEDLVLLDGFEKLGYADFSGSSCLDAITEWEKTHPLVDVRYTVTFPNGEEANNRSTELDLSGITDDMAEEVMAAFSFLPSLKQVSLGSDSDGLSPVKASVFEETFPDISFDYSFHLFGKPMKLTASSLNLKTASPEEIRSSLDTISVLHDLKKIDLGNDEREDALSWEDILALREAAPEAEIAYRFKLYDREVNLTDETLDFSYVQILDNGEALLDAARCMPHLKTLDMDSCGIGNQRMEEIRDALPDTEVIWRIFFGTTYTARTDVERILASSPSYGGTLRNRDIEVLKYCTKLKYLDIGHNEAITDLSVVNYMPDLEVLIIAMNPLGDLTPLAKCKHLEYLELFYSRTDDLSPLAEVKSLKHLNVGHCPFLHDISPIYDLDLERFYLGNYLSCPVPAEQVDHYRELHPDCEVDNTAYESSEAGWRRAANLEGEALEWYEQQPYYREDRRSYAPRYSLLRDQMGYDSLAYSVTWKDPTYHFVPWQPHTS